MGTSLRNTSLLSRLRLCAVLVTIAGALLAWYGVQHWPSFQYAFVLREEVVSRALERVMQRGLSWAEVLAGSDAAQNEGLRQQALVSLGSPHPLLYYIEAEGAARLTNIGEVGDVGAFFAALPHHRQTLLPDRAIIYVGLALEDYNALVADAEARRARGRAGLNFMVIGFVSSLLGAAFVMYAAGRQTNSSVVHLAFLDRLYLDVGLILYGGASLVLMIGMALVWTVQDRGGPPVSLEIGGLFAVIIALLGLQYLSSLSKRCKRGELLKHTLIYASIARVIGAGSLAVRASGLLMAYGASLTFSLYLLAVAGYGTLTIVSSLGLFGLVNIVALAYVVNRAAELKAIIVGTERVRSGDLNYRIPEKGITDFVVLASNINNIALGLQVALESEVKSERMKAELVTNVSHDLKTPLTSIIAYIDLLKTEGLQSENAAKYLGVLDKKSQRLKVLTDDLFEAAKTVSGNLSVKWETLDVGALLTQGLAELSGRIESSGLDFRVSIPPERLEVQADGKLLWRAIENVLSNALNYALAGSRVYVDAAAGENQVHLTFKNVSALPLNIGPDELVMRFKRGDESRSTEGSGLGLAIAKSLVELHRGTLKIDIDGDLFKVTLVLPTT